MRKVKYSLLLFIILLTFSIPLNVNAKNSDVPFFDGTDNTYLKANMLQLDGKLLRPGQDYLPPGAIADDYYGPPITYPALYNGSFSWKNQYANLAKGIEYQEPFIRIVNEGYFNQSLTLGDRMLTEIERMNENNIYNIYWGTPEFVLPTLIKHNLQSLGSPQSFGQFYWIRDIAYLSGGYAGAGVTRDINPHSLFVVRTSWPQIRKFNAEGNSLSKPVNFNVEGYEYVSKNKGYTDNDPNSTTENPYADSAGERNRVKWELVIEKGGKEVDRKEGYMRSEPWQDKQNPHEEDSGWFGGQGDSSPIRWQASECGKYKAKLKVFDGVQRESKVKETTFNIDKNCNAEPPPEEENVQTDEFQYKIDFGVSRIEGETVEKGSTVSTPVTVDRTSYINERNEYRNEYKEKIKLLEHNIENIEREKSNAQDSLNVCRADWICTTDKDGKQTCYQRDCSWYESELDNIITKLKMEKEKLKKEKEKLKRLEDLEDRYEFTTPTVTLKHNGKIVGSKTVTLQENDSTTIYFDWKVSGAGKIEAEINPRLRKYDNSKDVIKPDFTNNKLDTPIYTASHETGTCPRPGSSSSISAVVRTINDGGTKQNLYEYFNAQIVDVTKKTLRAGYGFGYKVKTSYVNEDHKSNATGAKRTVSFLPTMVDHLPYSKTAEGYQVQMDKTENSVYNPVWSLPKTYVEKYSGNVFDKNYKNHPDYNPKEIMLDGGRKWYTSFDAEDGNYPFKVMTYDAGVNRLNLCLTGEVKIEGSFIGDKKGNDDFIKRSVNPANPFPGQVGWNWKGKEYMLGGLTEWWTSWNYKDPKSVPEQGYHMETYHISPEQYKAIKAYNKEHGLKVDLDSNFFNYFNFK